MRLLIALLFMAATSTWAAKPTAWVLDVTNNQVVSSNDADTIRPIASLTKLMTAMIVLNSGDSLNESLLLLRRASTALPFSYYTRLELLNAMLVKSDNAAAETLADNYPGGRTAFLQTMNSHAQTLGMLSTNFDDPTGLSKENTSTPAEVGKMLQAANTYELIKTISTQTQTTVHIPRHKNLGLLNTNYEILNKFKDIVISKTGFTSPAGFCLGMVINRSNRQFVIVVMGEPNKNKRAATVDRIMRII